MKQGAKNVGEKRKGREKNESKERQEAKCIKLE